MEPYHEFVLSECRCCFRVLLPKLKYEHVYLTSRSKMRVDLAAQVRLYIGGPIGIIIFICTAHDQSGHE